MDANFAPTDTNTLYTVEGIVTTRVNMTTAESAMFYLQDATAGITVFIKGSTAFRPAAGDKVRVTGPLDSFNGLFEFGLDAANSNHFASILLSGNPLPTPALFDFATATNLSVMETQVEGSLVTVSNVFLQGAPGNFVVPSNINMTNQDGRIFFSLRIDARIASMSGKPIPMFAKSITGVMGQFDAAPPYNSGYQLLITRYAELVSAPTVDTQPTSRLAALGGNTTFNVTAGGTAPFTYQWLKDGSALSGKTGAALALTNLQTNDAGAYSVVISNTYGSITSSGAILTIQVVPLLTTEPRSSAISSGYPVTFTAAAVGAATLRYQWYKSGALLANATNTSYSITNALVADSGNYTVQVTNAFGATVSSNAVLEVIKADIYLYSTLAGLTGQADSVDGTNSGARFNGPTSLLPDDFGNIYVTDLDADIIRKLTPDGTNWVVTTLAGQAGQTNLFDGTNSTARFNLPDGIAQGPDGDIFIADSKNRAIRKMTRDGTNWVVTTIAQMTSNPLRIFADRSNNLYIACNLPSLIRKLTPIGTNWLLTTIAGSVIGSADGTNTAASFDGPDGIAMDRNGNLYVADYYNFTIRKLTPVGTNWVVTTIAGKADQAGSEDGFGNTARFSNVGSLAIDQADNLYVADTGNRTIRKITPAGTNWIVTTIGGRASQPGSTNGLSSAARFYSVFGVAVDKLGNVYVSDTTNNIIRKGTPFQAQPRFINPQTIPGSFSATLTGLLGWNTFILETSTNLQNWLPIRTNAVTDATVTLTNAASPSSPPAFLRAVVQ